MPKREPWASLLSELMMITTVTTNTYLAPTLPQSTLLLLLLLLLRRFSRGDTIDSSPPGSSVSGILQARILERVAISFSNA